MISTLSVGLELTTTRSRVVHSADRASQVSRILMLNIGNTLIGVAVPGKAGVTLSVSELICIRTTRTSCSQAHSASKSLGRCPRFCLSNQPPGDVDAAGPQTTLWIKKQESRLPVSRLYAHPRAPCLRVSSEVEWAGPAVTAAHAPYSGFTGWVAASSSSKLLGLVIEARQDERSISRPLK